MFLPLDDVDSLGRPRPLPGPYRLLAIGIDIGQIHDPSAFVAVEAHEVTVQAADPLFGEWPLRETHYRVLGGQRLPLGTPYPEVARRANLLAKRLYDWDSRGDVHMLVDSTGVGRPVCDLIRAQVIPQCHVTAVTLTGGDKGDPSVLWRLEASIGKAFLVSRLQALLQSRRIAAPMDADMAAMASELKGYEIKAKPETGHLQAGAFAVGAHDDLVTALGLAVLGDLSMSEARYGPFVGDLPSPVL